MFTLTGTLKVKFDEQVVSDKFKKRDFVVTDNSSQYPQHVSFQLIQDRCNLIEPFQAGQEVKVYFNLRGREWTSPQGELKYFNTIEAWKVENASVGNMQQPSQPTPTYNEQSAAPKAAESFIPASSQEDDLPF